jgi:ankyrin repeat protein
MKPHGRFWLSDRVRTVAKAALLFLFVVSTLGAAALATPNEDILAAAKAGDRAGVEAALTQGASVNAVATYNEQDANELSPLGLSGLTPLGIAAIYGHRNVAEFLLDRGANLDVRNGFEQTPLHTAAEHGSTDVAKLLLDRGADVNARDFLGATPLGWAALRGQKNVAALLIARGAFVNARALSGKTPLHLAAAAGKKDIVTLLLAHGADVKAQNSDSQTPLQEMEASNDLDQATKANIAAVLRAPARAPAPVRSPVATTTPPPPPANSQAPASNSLPACTDLRGIARLMMRANPDARPEVLAGAVTKYQEAMGCRPPPQKTECSWIGSTWTCRTK